MIGECVFNGRSVLLVVGGAFMIIARCEVMIVGYCCIEVIIFE